MGPRKGTARNQTQTPFEELLAAAEAKQQQAERRAAVSLYDDAIALFEQALAQAADANATQDEIQNAIVLLAESIQNKCELFLKLWESEGQRDGGIDPVGLLGEYNAEHEAMVFGQACEMLQASTSWYKSSASFATSGDASMDNDLSKLRVDALVNLGNTLSLWGTVASEPAKIDGLFRESIACYDRALLLEDDAATRNNKGDALIAFAEFLATHDKVEDAERAYEEALLAYDSAVQLSDSQKGDNLPMLLLDYGSAFLSMAEFCFKTIKDRERAVRLLEEAERRLRFSISFGRGSAGVHSALGEVYLLGGEIRDDMIILDKASDEFGAALRIQRTDVDGLIGAAETAVEKAKRVASNDDATRLYSQAVGFYQAAFRSNKLSGTLKEKSNVLYNYACCLGATGSPGAEAATNILSVLVSKGLVTHDEVHADVDLPPNVRCHLK